MEEGGERWREGEGLEERGRGRVIQRGGVVGGGVWGGIGMGMKWEGESGMGRGT